MKRREFLGSCVAGAALSGLLASCGGSDSSPAAVTGSNAGPTPSALDVLAQSLDGSLLVPSSPGFQQASLPFDLYKNFGPPTAILQATTARDVAKGIRFARQEGLPLAARCGGHNYAGYSTTSGLLISVRPMDAITYDGGTGRAVIGAGTRLLKVYSTLAEHGVLVPGGSCPTVGISGLVMGGGFGLNARKYGLLADSLLRAVVVLADGSIVTASDNQNSDLFWGIRGAAGGNFGYLAELEFQTHPVGRLALANVTWPWSRVREVFDAWQKLIPTIPNDLTMVAVVENDGKGNDPSKLSIRIVGQFHGSTTALREILQPIYDAGGTPVREEINDFSLLEAVFYFAGCDNAQDCQLVPVGKIPYFYYYVKSAYTRTPWSSQALDTLAAQMEKWPGTSQNCVLEFDSYGGAIANVAPTATAFVHRNELFIGQYQAYWGADDPASVRDAAIDWLRGFHAAMAPYNTPFAYQNYIDQEEPDWQNAYYGENFARLREVKRKYDPDDVFKFPQSIPL